MTTQQLEEPPTDTTWFDIQPHGTPRKPIRRVRGYRPKSIPNANLTLQILGVVAILCGVFMLWGFAATLLAGGAISAIIGTLREMQQDREEEARAIRR